MLSQIKESTAYIQSKTSIVPSIGIILGTGLGGLVKEIEIIDEINYEDIPNFPVSTVESHSGKLIFGRIGGKNVVAMQGRFHFYEGYTLQQVTFPVRVMKLLGIERLFVSNASGGVNPDFEVGEIMIMNDHINLFPGNPLIGKNIDELGPRFPDMSDPYDQEMIDKAVAIAQALNIRVAVGCYAGLTGPTLETPSEYKYVRTIGADAVGMSTVPEAIAAHAMGAEVLGISLVSNAAAGMTGEKLNHEEVIAAGKAAASRMGQLLKTTIPKLV